MIAASAVLVVVAFITLIIGIFQTGLGLIWMSIASSVLAAVFLLLGVVRGRPAKVATSAGAVPGSWADAAPVTYAEPTVDVSQEPDWAATTMTFEPEPVEEDEPVAPPARRGTAAARPAPSRAGATRASATRATATRATTSRAAARPAAKPAAKKTAAAAPRARTSPAQAQVVVIPDRDKFHRDSCRYAKGSGAMALTKSDARREGYKPCGVCKP